MSRVSLLRVAAEEAFRDLLVALEGVTGPEAWAVPQLQGRDYLHSDGSILGIVQHLATCKVMYASAGFRNTEVRWRDCADRVESLGADWTANQAYLAESQQYWLASRAALPDEELDQPRKTNWGETWPTRRIIATITHHDSYHGGQIALLRAMLKPASGPPPSQAGQMRRVLRDSPSW